MPDLLEVEYSHASLFKRVKAAVIDGIVIMAAMYLATELLLFLPDVSIYVGMVIAIVIFVLYEPFMVSITGATIGHSYSQIKVKRDVDSRAHLAFHAAFVRFLIKFLLGWLSLLTVTGDREGRVIHDMAVGSIVLEEQG